MRKAYVFLLLLATLTLVAAASSRQATEIQDEQELRQIEATTARCEQQNDVSMMKLFAGDWVANSIKTKMSKQQLEEAVRTNFVAHGNGPGPYTIEKKNMVVYLFGDTAVVTYIKEYRQTTDTTKFFDEDDTDVFKRGTTGWLLQFSKLSPVANTAVS
jgi:hypothetical protein